MTQVPPCQSKHTDRILIRSVCLDYRQMFQFIWQYLISCTFFLLTLSCYRTNLCDLGGTSVNPALACYISPAEVDVIWFGVTGHFVRTPVSCARCIQRKEQSFIRPLELTDDACYGRNERNPSWKWINSARGRINKEKKIGYVDQRGKGE